MHLKKVRRLGISKTETDPTENGEESKNPSTPTLSIEDTLEPESDDQAKLVRQIRITESLEEEIEKYLSSFHFKQISKKMKTELSSFELKALEYSNFNQIISR